MEGNVRYGFQRGFPANPEEERHPREPSRPCWNDRPGGIFGLYGGRLISSMKHPCAGGMGRDVSLR